MIKNIKVVNKELKDILLFDEIQNVKKLNVLFGGNGVGKTTFLNAIRDNQLEIETSEDIILKSFTNSLENTRINSQKELHTTREFVKAMNVKSYSEGQSILHYVLSFLYDIKELASETDKSIVVLLDEVDSGLSAENIQMLMWQIKELIETKKVQFFISTNHYHFVYIVKHVLNMYEGTYMDIKSYDDYFKLLHNGIQTLKNSNKREFNFLDVY